MNSVLFQHELANLHRQQLLDQADNARNAELVNTRTPNLLRTVANTLVQMGEKLQETTSADWSIMQPQPHLVK
jgi:hypothetical protein